MNEGKFAFEEEREQTPEVIIVSATDDAKLQSRTLLMFAFTRMIPDIGSMNIIAQELKEAVMSGDEDPMKVLVRLKYFSKVIKDATDVVIAEAERQIVDAKMNEKDDFTCFGATLKRRLTGKYDYTSSGHPEYNRLSEDIKPIEKRMKEIEKVLKALTKKTIFTDEDSGETSEVYPPSIKGKSKVTVAVLFGNNEDDES